jgi:hypothetical protein
MRTAMTTIDHYAGHDTAAERSNQREINLVSVSLLRD